jgi:hypothetical protein
MADVPVNLGAQPRRKFCRRFGAPERPPSNGAHPVTARVRDRLGRGSVQRTSRWLICQRLFLSYRDHKTGRSRWRHCLMRERSRLPTKMKSAEDRPAFSSEYATPTGNCDTRSKRNSAPPDFRPPLDADSVISTTTNAAKKAGSSKGQRTDLPNDWREAGRRAGLAPLP